MRKTSLTVAACALLLCAGTAQAKLNATQTCEQSKLTAQGALEVCLKQNSANILLGKPDGSATCWTNFNAALMKADATAAKSGASCRYVDNGTDANGDDTVSDLNTGLMWEKQTGTVGGTSTGRVDDVNNTYTWSAGVSTSDNLADGTAFTAFLATLNNGTSTDGGVSTPITGCFASHCDWRLPSIVELQGIVDASAIGCSAETGPCIDPTFGPTQFFRGGEVAVYWSATTVAGVPYGAWSVLFKGGILDQNNKLGDLYVRAVRGGLDR